MQCLNGAIVMVKNSFERGGGGGGGGDKGGGVGVHLLRLEHWLWMLLTRP
jgi:hypothetical protein